MTCDLPIYGRGQARSRRVVSYRIKVRGTRALYLLAHLPDRSKPCPYDFLGAQEHCTYWPTYRTGASPVPTIFWGHKSIVPVGPPTGQGPALSLRFFGGTRALYLLAHLPDRSKPCPYDVWWQPCPYDTPRLFFAFGGGGWLAGFGAFGPVF
jgi:hypothetical protein